MREGVPYGTPTLATRLPGSQGAAYRSLGDGSRRATTHPTLWQPENEDGMRRAGRREIIAAFALVLLLLVMAIGGLLMVYAETWSK